MKDLRSKTKDIDVHSHIDKAYQLITDNLPVAYLHKVRELLPKEINKLTTDNTIRNVRRRLQNPEGHPEVFEALIKLAKKHKEFRESIKADFEN